VIHDYGFFYSYFVPSLERGADWSRGGFYGNDTLGGDTSADCLCRGSV
jgi:hypothetical protein